MDLRAVSRLADAEATSQSKVADRVLVLVRAELLQFNGWYSPDQVEAVAARVGARVAAASRRAAALSDAYLARVVAEMVGGSPQAAGLVIGLSPVRDGVASYGQVYSRPAETYRYHRSQGLPPDVALKYTLQRVDAMVRTDLQLARRKQEQASMRSARGVDGYRRIVRPYLSEGGTCGLCVAAADRRYHVSELRPIHDRCKCDSMPIIGDMDPGLHLNDEDLGRLYDAGGSTRGADLKRVRVKVIDHGELGPQLAPAA